MAALASTTLEMCQTPQQTAEMNPSHWYAVWMMWSMIPTHRRVLRYMSEVRLVGYKTRSIPFWTPSNTSLWSSCLMRIHLAILSWLLWPQYFWEIFFISSTPFGTGMVQLCQKMSMSKVWHPRRGLKNMVARMTRYMLQHHFSHTLEMLAQKHLVAAWCNCH